MGPRGHPPSSKYLQKGHQSTSPLTVHQIKYSCWSFSFNALSETIPIDPNWWMACPVWCHRLVIFLAGNGFITNIWFHSPVEVPAEGTYWYVLGLKNVFSDLKDIHGKTYKNHILMLCLFSYYDVSNSANYNGFKQPKMKTITKTSCANRPGSE